MLENEVPLICITLLPKYLQKMPKQQTDNDTKMSKCHTHSRVFSWEKILQ